MNAVTVNAIKQVKNQQKKDFTKNFKGILYQAKKSIDVKNYEHPTCTLTKTLYKTAGEANTYVRFEYSPHTIFKHTWGQVSVLTNNDTINDNKQVKNQWCKYYK